MRIWARAVQMSARWGYVHYRIEPGGVSDRCRNRQSECAVSMSYGVDDIKRLDRLFSVMQLMGAIVSGNHAIAHQPLKYPWVLSYGL
jgi:hypothetical protein